VSTTITNDATRVVLRDGTTVAIRLARPDDESAIVAMHARCSAMTRYRRFLSGTPTVPEVVLQRLVHGDGVEHLALVATAGESVVGVASCHRFAPAAAELAIVVEDAYQGRGVGVALVARLAALASDRGVDTLVARTLSDNRGIRRLLDAAGFDVVAAYEDGLRVMTFPAERKILERSGSQPT
jgi:L-amino acid N-acyltransferase YncA